MAFVDDLDDLLGTWVAAGALEVGGHGCIALDPSLRPKEESLAGLPLACRDAPRRSVPVGGRRAAGDPHPQEEP
jgi:hypothetical protein